jgi:hypothetical protein
MVPPVPYPGQWGYQPYGNNNHMPRPSMPVQPSTAASSVPVAVVPVPTAKVNAPTTPSTAVSAPPPAPSSVPATEVFPSPPQHNPTPLPTIKQEQQPVLDKPISPLVPNSKKKATKIVLIYNNHDISPVKKNQQLSAF